MVHTTHPFTDGAGWDSLLIHTRYNLNNRRHEVIDLRDLLNDNGRWGTCRHGAWHYNGCDCSWWTCFCPKIDRKNKHNKNCCMLYISNYIVRLSLLKLVFYASFFYFANIFILKRCPCQSRPNVQSRTAWKWYFPFGESINWMTTLLHTDMYFHLLRPRRRGALSNTAIRPAVCPSVCPSWLAPRPAAS